jgi:hypothetical protein
MGNEEDEEKEGVMEFLEDLDSKMSNIHFKWEAKTLNYSSQSVCRSLEMTILVKV